ncbi:MAG: FkbM family methyltransferase [Burkholderiales bacterium]|nr:FkbM family methyltransferase [Opitutaceae bacterium]
MTTLSRRQRIEADLSNLSARGYDIASEAHRGLVDLHARVAAKGEFDHIDAFIDPAKASIDVGANGGQFSLKLAATSARVLVVEPLQEFAYLEHALPAQCTFRRCALGETTGEAQIKIPRINGDPMSGMASFYDLTEFGYRDFDVQTVAIRLLDDVVAEALPDLPVGFIKMDVEGWELPVLRGARRLIARDRPNLLVEIWPQQMPKLAQDIEALGYRGLFFFDGRIHDVSRFDHAIHTAPENDWNPEKLHAFRPELHVNNFFFVPVTARS